MVSRDYVTLDAEVLRRLLEDLFTASGVPVDLARQAADVHLEADLRGVGLQGIDYVPYEIAGIRKGQVVPDAVAKVVSERGGVCLMDGCRGLGECAAIAATEELTKLASLHGIAAVGITNGGDVFMLGYYVERLARAGLVGIALTSGPPLVHPHGGIERMLSTNPIAFGLPRTEDPLIFDMATSALANSRIRQAAYYDETVPIGTGVDAAGRSTTDPNAITDGGAIAPLAGHKGFGLGLVLGLLAGPLTGSAIGPALAGFLSGDSGPGIGHLFLALDPERFVGLDGFRTAMECYLDAIKASDKAEGVTQIRIPGERLFTERARRLREGVPILGETWRIVADLAAQLGVDAPDPGETIV